MTEIWKDIKGFEDRYQISNFGNVKSLRYGGRNEIRNLVPKVNNKGYEWVELFANGERRCLQVHRLVADAFLPNPNKYPIINHKDENPRNNRVENLEWCDQKYNVHYYFEHHKERYKKLNFDKGPRNHRRRDGCFWINGPSKRKKKVIQIDKDGNTIKIWDNVSQIARERNMSQWSITQCCEGKRKTAYGCIWRFMDAI